MHFQIRQEALNDNGFAIPLTSMQNMHGFDLQYQWFCRSISMGLKNRFSTLLVDTGQKLESFIRIAIEKL